MTDKQKILFPMNLQFFAEKDVLEVTEPEVIPEPLVEPEMVPDVSEVPEVITEIPEIVVEPVKADDTERVAELEAKLAEVQTQLDTANQSIIELTATIEESGKSVETATQQAETYQKSLETIVAEKEKDIPEDLKALMPENISVTEKLAWLDKAESLKPKDEEKAEKITAIGRPTPVTEQVVDQSELTVTQKLSNTFGSIFDFK